MLKYITLFILFSVLKFAHAAKEEVSIELQVAVKVNTYTELILEPHDLTVGVTKMSDDRKIVEATITVSPRWEEDTQRMRIGREEIYLKLSNDEMVPVLGDLSFANVFDWSTSDVSLSANSSTSASKAFRVLFAVPSGATRGQLHVGNTSQSVDLPAANEPLISGVRMKGRVLDSGLVDTLPKTYEEGGLYIHSTLRNPYGRFLKVILEIETHDMEEAYGGMNWSYKHFGAVLEGGAYVPCQGSAWTPTGRRTGDWEVSDHIKNISRRPDVYTEELYFAVPTATRSFQIYYASNPIADGNVGQLGVVAVDKPQPELSDAQQQQLNDLETFAKSKGVLAYVVPKGTSPYILVEWILGQRPTDADAIKMVRSELIDYAKQNCKDLRITNSGSLK